MMTWEEQQQIGALLLHQSWVFAKTMPKNPHWYTLRKSWEHDADFVHVVEQIRAHGVRERYGKSAYTVLYLNGFLYWTMGAPLASTILINRKVVASSPQPYDAIALRYDALFADKASQTENEQVMDFLGAVQTQHVLDIGCGTGLLLDYCTPRSYTGIEPSAGMREQFARKHPQYAMHLVPCAFEAFASTGYDLALALFGTASYLDLEALRRLPSMLRRGGRYVLMFYHPAYRPLTHQHTGCAPTYSREGLDVLPGSLQTIGNFLVRDGSL